MESPATAASHSKSLRALVLEDDPIHRQILTFNLTEAGFRVATAAEAAKALKLANHERFDLIITDYHLPDCLGTDFVRRLRATDGYEGTPVVMLTAWAGDLDRPRLEEELAIRILPKPCSVEDLSDMVSKWTSG